jgi:tetratricopeptide (TPR) repeat protein
MKPPPRIMILSCFASAAFGQTTAKPGPAQLAEAYYKQGLAAEKAGDPVAAKQAYLSALQMNPKHANARYSLGQLQLNSASIAAKGREAKFNAVAVPEFRITEASLQESLDALSRIVEEESKKELAPNFMIQDPQEVFAKTQISLNLKKLPAGAVLKYLLEQAGAKARHDEHVIVVLPK